MTRSAAREIAMRLCFCNSENPKDPNVLIAEMFDAEYYETLKDEDELFADPPRQKQIDYITRVVSGISAHGAELDGYIDKHSVGWRFARISRTAAAIMKTAMYEVLYMPDIPNRAAINEAVEISKRYEEPETVSFINGLLGSFIKAEAME